MNISIIENRGSNSVTSVTAATMVTPFSQDLSEIGMIWYIYFTSRDFIFLFYTIHFLIRFFVLCFCFVRYCAVLLMV